TRMAPEFCTAPLETRQSLDEGVHLNELRQTGPRIVLSIEATVIVNPRSITSQWKTQLACHVQEDRFQRAAAMDVLMRVQVGWVAASQAAELGKLPPDLVLNLLHVLFRNHFVQPPPASVTVAPLAEIKM